MGMVAFAPEQRDRGAIDVGVGVETRAVECAMIDLDSVSDIAGAAADFVIRRIQAVATTDVSRTRGKSGFGQGIARHQVHRRTRLWPIQHG